MSSIFFSIRQKYKEITGNANADDVPLYDMNKVIKAYEKGRADAIEDLKPFFEKIEDYSLDWICDELCGEFINPQTDESWCAEHCYNGTDYECIKKWCELKGENNG